jgi:hypothetical protein
MTSAGFLIKERIEEICSPIVAPKELVLHPGRGGEDEDEVFGTYNIVQNRLYKQPYRSSDIVDINIYHDSFTILQDCMTAILDDLNAESFVTHPINVNDDDIRFTNIFTSQSSSSENVLINGKEAFGARVAIIIDYVRL